MALTEIGRDEVELALAQFDEVGRAGFIQKYGFGFANTYLLSHDGHLYDPKAILGVAHSYTGTGDVLKPSDFDATEAIGRLRKLDFSVVNFNGLWWVNQGSTYRQERDGAYVWAPKLMKSGVPAKHHTAVTELQVGQKVVHYANGHIRAIGTVVASPEGHAKPDELTGDAWASDGNICRVTYRELDSPIPLADVPNKIPAVGPFNVNGSVNQGYLYRIANAELMPLLEFLADRVPDLFDPASTIVPPLPNQTAEPRAMSEPDPIHDLLQDTKNVVLEGVPGTGKTFAIQRLAANWEARTGRELMKFDGALYRAIVMHPSTSYEDFVEGMRPQLVVGASSGAFFDERVTSAGTFGIEDGFFVEVCALAVASPEKDVLVLLDELNRCNVASVLGDLLLVLEGSRRAVFTGVDPAQASARDWSTAVPVRLAYSGRTFFVPDNIYVLATANTTDRSVAPLDAALRRRFSFYRLEPEMPTTGALVDHLTDDHAKLVVDSSNTLRDLNQLALRPCLGPDAMLGQSYLFAMAKQLRELGVNGDARAADRATGGIRSFHRSLTR